jgi:ABC-2 type transport system permease protein
VLLFRPALTITPLSLLIALPALAMGFLIRFLIESIITLVAFWTTRVWSLWQLDEAIAMLLNGAFVPLALMPTWVQTIAQILPYQLGLSFPVLLILNRLPADQIALNFGLQVVWIGALYGAFTLLWRQALKQYSAVGA